MRWAPVSGRRLAGHAERILAMVEEAETDLSARAQEPAGRIRQPILARKSTCGICRPASTWPGTFTRWPARRADAVPSVAVILTALRAAAKAMPTRSQGSQAA